jgi:hypothetical protein
MDLIILAKLPQADVAALTSFMPTQKLASPAPGGYSNVRTEC